MEILLGAVACDVASLASELIAGDGEHAADTGLTTLCQISDALSGSQSGAHGDESK